MTETPKRPLQVFLCHASADKSAVRALYRRLKADGISAWLDEEDLDPGDEWQFVISKAVRNSDVVIACLSHKSVNKEGYVQKEIAFALNTADEKPEGTIYIIPAKLEECEVPQRLRRWQWVELAFDGSAFDEHNYAKLMRSLRKRANSIDATLELPKAPAMFEHLNVPNASLTAKKQMIEEKAEKYQQRRTKLRLRQRWNVAIIVAMLGLMIAIFATVFGFPFFPTKTPPPTLPLGSVTNVTVTKITYLTTTPTARLQNTPTSTNLSTSTQTPTNTSIPGAIPITVENVKNIKLIAEWNYDNPSTKYFEHIIFSPDSKSLVFTHNEYVPTTYDQVKFNKGYLIQRNIIDGKIRSTKEISKIQVLDEIIFQGNQLIGVGREDYERPYAMWLLPEQNKFVELQNSSNFGGEVTFSPDHSLLVIHSWDVISGWEAASGKLLFTVPKYANYVDTPIGVSPDNNFLAWIRVGTARVYSISKHEFLYTIDKLQGTNPTDKFSSVYQNNVFFSPNGKLLVLNSVGGVQIRNANDGSLIRVLKREGITATKNCWYRGYKKIEFSSNSHLLAIEDEDGSIGLWDVDAGNLVKVLAPPFSSLQCPYFDKVLFSPNSGFLLWASSSYYYDETQDQIFYNNKVQVWGISP